MVLPSLSPYCGTKGFDVAFSKSLWNEMHCEKVQLDVVCMVPGQVVSGMNEGPPALMASEKTGFSQFMLNPHVAITGAHFIRLGSICSSFSRSRLVFLKA